MDGEALAKEELGALLAAWLMEPRGLLRRLLGPGQALDLGTQRRMEAIFGRDLSGVRVHDTHLAGRIAAKMRADAFTVGARIFAAPDRLAPTAQEGMALLGHELTHVVQQTQPATVYPQPAAYPALPVAWGHPLPTAVARFPEQPTLAPFQVQFAAPDAETDALEVEAIAAERSVREISQSEQSGPAEVDLHEVADRVYRLMRDDLRLERERGAF